jgi:hypothetical protein
MFFIFFIFFSNSYLNVGFNGYWTSLFISIFFYVVILVLWPEFGGLIRVDSSHLFCYFLVNCFLNFNHQHWVDWEFASFFFMGLSQSHNPDHKFCGLARLVWVFFLVFFNFILQHWVDWEFDFIIFSLFSFYRVIAVSWFRFGKLTLVE